MILIALVCLSAVYFGYKFFAEYLLPLYPWLEYVGCAIAAAVVISVFYQFKDTEIEGLLRSH